MNAKRLGTPKTLKQAITNGIEALKELPTLHPDTSAEMIEHHVRDFLAQKFGVAMLDSRNLELETLFKVITRRET